MLKKLKKERNSLKDTFDQFFRALNKSNSEGSAPKMIDIRLIRLSRSHF